MKRLILSTVAACIASGGVLADECRQYTSKQRTVLQQAHSYGLMYGYGELLPAIVQQESFVGDRILRYNPNDPSTGITHISIGTLKHFSKLGRWDLLELAEDLITDDLLSYKYSIMKLDSISGNVARKAYRYNGIGFRAKKYSKNVMGIIEEFRRCSVLPNWG